MKGKLTFGLGFLLLGLTLLLISIATPAATASTFIVLRLTFTPLLTPTSTPLPTPRPTPPPGAYIELHLTPPDLTFWTQVEWQDGLGAWHRVDGWQGTVDKVENAVGIKRWWLPRDLFGLGPFRWAVLGAREGHYLTVSEPFTLPTTVNTVTTVDVSIIRASPPYNYWAPAP